MQFHQDSPDTTHQPADGCRPDRSALGRGRLGSVVGVLRVEGGKSGITKPYTKAAQESANDPPSQPSSLARCGLGSCWRGDRCGCDAHCRLVQYQQMELEVMKWLIFLTTPSE